MAPANARDGVDAGLPNPTGNSLATIAIVFACLCTALVSARLATRVFINKMTGWDDYFLIVGLLLAIGMAVCFNEQVHWGMGMHAKEVNADHKIMAFKWLYADQLLYKIDNGIVKISILLLYLRIFPSKSFRIAAYVIMAYVVAYCTAASASSIWQCKPIAKAWDKTLPGHCIDIGAVWYANSVLTIVADVAIILLPMNQIVRLQLPNRQKIGLAFLFSLGLFVIACTVVRMVSLGPSISQKDSTYYQAKSNSWTFLEIDVAIICACLPVLKAPISRIFPNLFGKRHLSTHNRSASTATTIIVPPNVGPNGTIIPSHAVGGGAPHAISDWSAERSYYNHSDTVDYGRPKLDNASDEELMLDDMNIIRKTTDIKFQYEERDRGETSSNEEKRPF